MRILITGGTGTVGREAVKRLVAHGHEVLVVGRREGLSIEGADYAACDISNFEAVRNAVRGRESVVHLAAIPNPLLGPGHEIFRVNASGTYNVYEAAAQEGIKRVVAASSINAFGYTFGNATFPLRYFPIDEEHETCTTDPYSFSKQIIEEIGRYYWRRDGISSVSLRLPAVYEIDGPSHGFVSANRREMAARIRQVIDMPPGERRYEVDAMLARYSRTIRQTRFFEQPIDGSTIKRMRDEPDNWLIMQRDHFWTSVDARDSAQAIELGLTVNYDGSHPLFINDDRNTTGCEAKVLTDGFFAGVPWKRNPVADQSLVSIERAQELLGFAPVYHATDQELD